MSTHHLADYFAIGPHSKRWTQHDLTGWFDHYNRVGHVSYALQGAM